MAKTTTPAKETPLMKQYKQIKAKHPGALLLFRVGDFYETFGEDAVKTAGILGIVLTKRANGSASEIALAGFPHHSLDNYLPKLVRAGQRVAICEQLEDPSQAKGIVERGVTELVTPGVAFNDKILDHRANNYLAAVQIQDKVAGISFIDVSTGEFLVAEGPLSQIEKLMQSLQPAEILFPKGQQAVFQEAFGEKWYAHSLESWVFSRDYAEELLNKQFETRSVKGFGIEAWPLAVIAAGAALHYLQETQQRELGHIQGIARLDESDFVWMDRFTIRNLELVQSSSEGGVSLFEIIDKTHTPMGARLLKRWLVFPLRHLAPINDRLAVVDWLIAHPEIAEQLAAQLKQIGDLERLVSKVAVGRVSPRELVQLARSLALMQPIRQQLQLADSVALTALAEQINPCEQLQKRLESSLEADAPAVLSKGNVIAAGVDPELDELRQLAGSAREMLQALQLREIERTGIGSLKVSYNNVFGYYIEVTNTHKDKVPADWIRKQTLVNAERYITEELKTLEEKILGAAGKIQQLEERLFADLVYAVNAYLQPIQLNAQVLARFDCLLGFYVLANENHYCRPQLDESLSIWLQGARHPVIEKRLPPGETYVPNDLLLDADKQQLLMITGPNMAGKSALLRQTALICLMAQMGAYVPAAQAQIGLVDKIFTRVGATDNISSGESTFMVEMNETASILNNISARSLILLDEIGRGTSTYDGISLAWAIAEYLHQHPVYHPRTLFATHYHELNEMEKVFARIKNFNVSIKEVGNKILFLRKLVPGGSEHSFGIQVARMAGLPQTVVQQAQKLLEELEAQRDAGGARKLRKTRQAEFQLNMFEVKDPQWAAVRQQLEQTDINRVTPVEALFLLNELKKMLAN